MHNLDDADPRTVDGFGQAGSLGTGALDRERQQVPQALGPATELLMSDRVSRQQSDLQHCSDVA